MRHLTLLIVLLYTISASAQSKAKQNRENGITPPQQVGFVSENLDHKPNLKHIDMYHGDTYVIVDEVMNAISREHYRMRKQYAPYDKALINVYGYLTEHKLTVIDASNFVNGKIVVASTQK